MYLIPWNLDCDLRVSWSFLQNNNHRVVKKILDIEHSPYYIALGSTQTHKVI